MKRWFWYTCAAVWLLWGHVASVHAWGCKGHQTVAVIAEAHLSTQAKSLVDRVLGEFRSSFPGYVPPTKYGCDPALGGLAGVASWPDDVKVYGVDDKWHFVDVPRGTTDPAKIKEVCGTPSSCVVRAIHDQIERLRTATVGKDRAAALAYVVHFLGDVHQPLHAATNGDRGGNCVAVWEGNQPPQATGTDPDFYRPELHGEWDTTLLEADIAARGYEKAMTAVGGVGKPADLKRYAAFLDKKFARYADGWSVDTAPEQWAWEGFKAAESIAYGELHPAVADEPDVIVDKCADNDEIGKRMRAKHVRFDRAYRKDARALIEKRLAQAGVRLAMVLNTAAEH